MNTRHLQRFVPIIGLLLVLACQSGCARTRPTINRLWEKVPPVRWPSRESTADAQHQKASEPTVAANVALKKETDTDSTSAVDARPRSLSNPFGSRTTPVESRPDEASGRVDLNDAWDTGSAGAALSESEESPLDRLNAALTDTIQNSLPERSVTILEERLRVDSLVSEARELLEIGQLDRAREVAVTAQELGESAHLEYAPDEDRPMDLVRRIESRMDSNPVSRDSKPEAELSSTTNPKNEGESSLANKQTQAVDKDGKGSPKGSRAWSNLFRRDKKPNTPSSDPGTQTSNHPVPTAPADSPSPVTSMRSSRQESRDAIVMANRSVSLEPTEQVAETAVATASASTQSYPDQDSSNSLNDTTTETRSLVPELEANTLMSDAENREATAPAFDSNLPALPDLESIEVSQPSAGSKLSAKERRATAQAEDQDPELDRGSNSLFIYIVFGICCVLAIACYRRGAT